MKGFLGFSAGRTNPFEPSSASRSRIKPFYDFDIASVGCINNAAAGRRVYWPKVLAVTDKTNGPMVYFRAENANYTIDGWPQTGQHTCADLCDIFQRDSESSVARYGLPSIRHLDLRMTSCHAARPRVTWVNNRLVPDLLIRAGPDIRNAHERVRSNTTVLLWLGISNRRQLCAADVRRHHQLQ